MSGWLVIENTKKKTVEILNLNQVEGFVAGKDKFGRIDVGVDSIAVPEFTDFTLEDWGELEKLINSLPAVKDLGWIYIVDGRVQAWKGKLKLLSNAEEGQQ